MLTTQEEFQAAMRQCREVFARKLHDYGASWRLMRPASMTDQIMIKAERIRQVQESGVNMVGEGIRPEFVGIVNYSIVALIQLARGASLRPDLSPDEALAAYDEQARESLELMLRKNHDYGDAWRRMRLGSYVDLILTKVMRTKQIEDLGGETLDSEGVDANYRDMMNYAVFGLIQLGV